MLDDKGRLHVFLNERGGLFRRKGLTVDQRFQYALAGVNYLLSLAALILMCLPAAYLLFGIRKNAGLWTASGPAFLRMRLRCRRTFWNY